MKDRRRRRRGPTAATRPPRPKTTAGAAAVPIGARLTVDVGPAVSGGRCLARHEGQVVFVRGALPNESVEVLISGHGRGGAFLWADVTTVLTPSPDRVVPPCPVAGVCGGCDWQHCSLPAQRMLKAQVIVDALRRTGGIEHIAGVPLNDAVVVESLDDGDGFGWRTRMRFATNANGALGLRRYESHDLVEAAGCLLACEPIRTAAALVPRWPAKAEIAFCSSSTGDLAVVADEAAALPPQVAADLPPAAAIAGIRGDGWVTEVAAGRRWRVRPDGFWQVHPRAAQALVDVVMELAAPRAGQSIVDLYAGCGLFSGSLGAAVGPQGRVDAVEGDAAGAHDCAENLADLTQVTVHHAPVQQWLQGRTVGQDAVFVMDPPRAGVGLDVVQLVASYAPRAVVYVACDPVALARDAAGFGRLGYRVRSLRCLDLFPMTKHVECVALLERE